MKIEDTIIWAYSNGKWWDVGSTEQQTVDDSDRLFGPCPDCGLVDCICRVGY